MAGGGNSLDNNNDNDGIIVSTPGMSLAVAVDGETAPVVEVPPEPSSDGHNSTIPPEQRQVRRSSTGSSALVSLEWERPSWVKKKLKPTEKGDVLKQGKDLQSPITHIREKRVTATKFFTPPASPAAQQPKQNILIYPKSAPTNRKTLGGGGIAAGFLLPSFDVGSPTSGRKKHDWERPSWLSSKLKATKQGSAVKEGKSLQEPITHVEKNHLDSINFEANPMNLKATDKGVTVKLGETLAKPVTHIEKDPMADINFEANPAFVLQETPEGSLVRQGAALTKPITHVDRPEGRDVNWTANPALLCPTEQGAIAKQVGNLAGPITQIRKDHDPMGDINLEATPNLLRPTDQGCSLRIGEDIAKPITHIRRTIKNNNVTEDTPAEEHTIINAEEAEEEEET